MRHQQESTPLLQKARINWIIKDNHLGDSFFQKDAGNFFHRVIFEALTKRGAKSNLGSANGSCDQTRKNETDDTGT